MPERRGSGKCAIVVLDSDDPMINAETAKKRGHGIFVRHGQPAFEESSIGV